MLICSLVFSIMKLFYLQTWFIFLQVFATMPSSSTTSVEDWKLSKFAHWWCTMFYGNLVCLYCYCLEYYKQITIIIMQVPIWKFWIIYSYVNLAVPWVIWMWKCACLEVTNFKMWQMPTHATLCLRNWGFFDCVLHQREAFF